MTQAGCQGQALCDLLGQPRRIELYIIPPARLRVIHGRIGVLQEFTDAAGILWATDNTKTARNEDCPAPDPIDPSNGPQDSSAQIV
ncbi:hypothetical protein D3C72_1973200 [compost metagenome]